MKQEVKSMIIVCDGCGESFHDGNDFCSYIDDENGELIEQSALDSEWLKFGDKHYCPDCYELDDEDHYHTKDGKVWDAETEKEIIRWKRITVEIFSRSRSWQVLRL